MASLANLITTLRNLLPDNTTAQISPADAREQIIEVAESCLNIDGIEPGHIPIRGANNISEPSGLVKIGSILVAPDNFMVEQGSIDFADSATLMNAGSLLAIQNQITSAIYQIVDHRIYRDQASDRPSYFQFPATESAFTQIFSGNAQTHDFATGGKLTSAAWTPDFEGNIRRVRFDVASALTDFRFVIIDDATDNPVHYHDSVVNWKLQQNGTDHPAGALEIELDVWPAVDNVRALRLELEATSGSIRTDGTSPWFGYQRQPGTRRRLIDDRLTDQLTDNATPQWDNANGRFVDAPATTRGPEFLGTIGASGADFNQFPEAIENDTVQALATNPGTVDTIALEDAYFYRATQNTTAGQGANWEQVPVPAQSATAESSLISEHLITSATASINIDIPNEPVVKLVFDSLSPTTDALLYMRWKRTTDADFATAGYSSAVDGRRVLSGGTTDNVNRGVYTGGQFVISGATLEASTTNRAANAAGHITIYGPRSGRAAYTGSMIYENGAASIDSCQLGGMMRGSGSSATLSIDRISISFAAGNIARGNFRLYKQV